MLWSQDTRPKVIEELDNLSVTAMAKQLDKPWGALYKEQKEDYEDLARKETWRITRLPWPTTAWSNLMQKQGAAVCTGARCQEQD